MMTEQKVCCWISVALAAVAIALIWSAAGWKAALGAFLLHWAINIDNAVAGRR